MRKGESEMGSTIARFVSPCDKVNHGNGKGQTGDFPRAGLMLGGVTQVSGCGGLAGVFSCCPLRGGRPAEPASPADGVVAFLFIRFPVARHGWVQVLGQIEPAKFAPGVVSSRFYRARGSLAPWQIFHVTNSPQGQENRAGVLCEQVPLLSLLGTLKSLFEGLSEEWLQPEGIKVEAEGVAVHSIHQARGLLPVEHL
jgi:hypothetical protein